MTFTEMLIKIGTWLITSRINDGMEDLEKAGDIVTFALCWCSKPIIIIALLFFAFLCTTYIQRRRRR